MVRRLALLLAATSTRGYHLQRLTSQWRHHRPQPIRAQPREEPSFSTPPVLSGILEAQPSLSQSDFEDAAYFSLSKETVVSWAIFGAAVSVVLASLYVLWIRSDTGYCDDFLAVFEQLDPHLATLALGSIFSVAHSGLAALRPRAETIVGPRAWRVFFALVSLPLAYAWIVFFVVHRYDGIVLWKAPSDWHAALWLVNFVSFFFLYPSTFNLKEVAAVDKPELHIWGTGVARITRHPQAFGQTLWSLAHGALIGTSVTAVTMAMLVGHHAFSVWHGDRRLEAKYGDRFRQLERCTSVIPFVAIIDGRQQLPPDYWREWIRGPYAIVAIGTLAAYVAHPFMIAGGALFENTGLQPGGIFG